MDLSKSLKVAKAQKDVKHKDLAEALGVTRQQVSKWITSGSISQAYLLKICEYFELEVSEFIALGEG